MAFKKGQSGNASGRPKGALNKVTLGAKEVIEAMFDGIGGLKRAITWADENPTEFYKMYSKLLPRDVNVTIPDAAKSEPIPATNSWLGEIIAARSADADKGPLSH